MTNIFEIPLFFEVFGKYCRSEDIHFNLVNGLSPDTSYFRKTFPFPNLIRHNAPCNMPFKYVYFTYDGKVTLCCRDYEAELVIGDIKKDRIIDIWNSARAENIREQHLNPDKLTIKACQQCFFPYKFISSLVDSYIHYLYLHHPDMNPQEFGNRILDMLKGMDAVMEAKDKQAVKQYILEKGYPIKMAKESYQSKAY